jgi:hypothetical protein
LAGGECIGDKAVHRQWIPVSTDSFHEGISVKYTNKISILLEKIKSGISALFFKIEKLPLFYPTFWDDPIPDKLFKSENLAH